MILSLHIRLPDVRDSAASRDQIAGVVASADHVVVEAEVGMTRKNSPASVDEPEICIRSRDPILLW
ncbi:hypothetical protein DYI20_08500 [Auritidibacter ignavus]|nr:hypothetical protein DCC24_07975 [Auritidibacter sp. NML100628]PXA82501.1 hypothetical protein DCC26_00135 [Auritidibacter sp. NML120779]RMX22744.1 hypothetical protein DYI20_08500 [Auritidibacter ignavus]